MSKVLVTGATGYIGGRLVTHLQRAGADVVGTSRNPGRPPANWPAECDLVQYSLASDPPVAAQDLRGVDAVIHLAAANETRSGADPDGAIFETVTCTRRLLDAAIRAGVQRFVFFSTIHAYGPLRGNVDERAPASPVHPYAITHLAAEHFVNAARERGEIAGVVVRLSNGIGAPAWSSVDRWSLIGTSLPLEAVETGVLTVKTPDQWRDFITLGDICAGVDTLLNAPAPSLAEGVYNLGGDMPLKVIDVARRVASAAEEVLGRPIRIESPAPGRDTDAPPFNFDISRMRALGFRPSGTPALAEELKTTVRLVAQTR